MRIETLEPRTRPLHPSERRLLATRVRELRSRSADAPKVFLLGKAIFGVLWLLTLLASDASWILITLFWIVVGGTIILWVWWDARKNLEHVRRTARRMRAALEHDRAEVYDIEARAYAEFEEVEDEGACYAFDLGDGRLVFLAGQRFYPAARFPSLDFSLVRLLDPEGAPVDGWIEKRGERAEPDRVIPADVKWELEIPDSLGVVRGTLERLEEVLPKRGGRAW